MRSIFTLFFVFFSLLLISQEESETDSKFHLGLTVSPQMSFAGLNSQDFETFENSSRLKFSWSAGAKSRYVFSKSFAAEVGILFQQRNYEFESGSLIFGSQIITGSNGTRIEDEIRLNSVSVPVAAVFTIVEKWNILMGTRLNFYIEDIRTRTVHNIPEGEDEELFSSLDTETETSPIELVFGIGKRLKLGNLSSELNLIFSYNFNDIEFPVGGLSTIQSSLGLGWNIWIK